MSEGLALGLILGLVSGLGLALGFLALRGRRTARQRDVAPPTGRLAVNPMFLTTMSHELRTPLNAVIGFSDMIKSQAMGPVGTACYIDYARNIHDSGHHLLGLINDILDLTRADAGLLQLTCEPTDISEAIRASLDKAQPAARARQLTLTTAGDDDLPEPELDERRLRQVLDNLISNAIKFSHTGGVVRIETARAADGGVVISIADDGIGMARGDIEAALERFRQLDDTHSRNFAGSGLGLPLSKALVELMGGVLQLESAPGAGTTARIILPGQTRQP